MFKQLMQTMAIAVCLIIPASRVLTQPEHAPAAHSEPAEGTGHGEAGEHAKPPLLPRLDDPQTWWSALWVVIIFVVLLAVLYPTAWKNVLAGLKKREERIRKDIADAETARAKAEATLRDYNAQLATAEAKVRELISKATIDGEQMATSIRARAQQEAEEIKERANRDIESAKDQAVQEIKTLAADLSTSIAEKILRRKVTVEDQRALVESSLEQLQRVKAN